MNASKQNLDTFLANQDQVAIQNRESSLLSTQNIDVQQYCKKVIPQIRSQQLSPVGIPLSRAFSQTSRRYKVKINTNNIAIPKDFFSNIIDSNEINSTQFLGKENNQKFSNNTKQNMIINLSQKQDGIIKSTVFQNESYKFEQDISNTKNTNNLYDQGVTYRAQDLLNLQKNSNNFSNARHQCMEIQLANSQDSKLIQCNQLNEQAIIQNITTPKFVEKKLVFGNQNEGIEQDFNTAVKSQRKITSTKRVQRNFIRNQLHQQQQDIALQTSFQTEQVNLKNVFEQSKKQIQSNKNQFFDTKDALKQIYSQTSLERNNKNLILTNQENNQLSNILINKGNLSYSKQKSFPNNQNNKVSNSDINNNQEISNCENSVNKYQIIQLTKSSYSCDQEECRVAKSEQIIKNKDKNTNQTTNLQKTDPQKNLIQKKVRKINIKNEQNQEEKTQINSSNEINDCNKLANMITLTNEFIFNKQIINQSEKQDNSSSNNIFIQDLKNQINMNQSQSIEKQPVNSVQNSKICEDFNKFSLEKIKKNLFQDTTQQQRQINIQANSCKKLSDCYKNTSSEAFPQLFIIDSDQNFKLNQQNQRLLENRSTTTSQLTKRQQMLYLQGQIKKRNQLSLHEDYNSKQSQLYQQQQQQLISNPKNYIQKKYSINQNFNDQQQGGEPFSLQNLMQNTSFEKFEQNYYSAKSQQQELEGSLNQQFNSNQNELLPKLYPTKVNYKSHKDRNFSLNYLKKQNLAQSQYQIISPTYTNSNIDNQSQILNPQTCNNFNQPNSSNNIDLNSITKNLIPLNLVKGQIFSNYSHREKIQTSDTTPSSKQELSKINFQLLKYEQQLNQKNNQSPQSFIKIEQDIEDI
ncbi:hypothetical protein TTHERM_00715880 (macronuclear) [Tetrahymena thermophila SB210]|uniref:Uncharacterized protein n=1 Tax=Tetrahymena thermophila (strain SB210) TaxID=312017 RepID=I7M650_TETTS|nr:hypothetical protein TTHERM_00715880 [Tetrahymena thermophila SB210]EAR84284.2 hypothetical protein TTHERM_00715880 [Tetrahymena thermophila SB210]|eukprot:XP_001031947.2 hypothetical protein TTHERM_00715880 [Tetrahymena thermophila SB210]